MGKGSQPKKQKNNTLPGVQSVPRRKSRGRARMNDLENRGEVIEARVRMLGKSPNDNAARKAAKAPSHSCEAGRALVLSEGEVVGESLYKMFAGFQAAQDRYMRLTTGLSLHAGCAKLETTPERFETRADDRPDLRSEEEKLKDATNRWMAWQGRIGRLDVKRRALINQVSIRDEFLVVIEKRGAKLTGRGADFVDAMKALAKSSGTL